MRVGWAISRPNKPGSMSNDIQVVALTRGSRDVQRFLKVSYGIYRDDPHWVAPLLMDLKKVFTDANPLFEHAEMQLWVATRGGRDVGRIAGILDHNHNRAAKDQAAFFGFYECLDDAEVSRRLFGVVLDWARQKGLKRVLGPMNPTTNDECGLLVEGFDLPPVIMMTYNPRYYLTLVEAEGFRKAKDLLAFNMDLAKIPMDRLGRIASKIKQRNPYLAFRPVRRKTLAQDLVKVKEVYNAAWQQNWGFVPMTDAEFDHLAKGLKMVLDPDLIFVVEAKGKPVGMGLTLPDVNEPLRRAYPKPGVPEWWTLIKFFYNLKFRKVMKYIRVLVLGVLPEYRVTGLDGLLYAKSAEAAMKKGYYLGELSWILENNVPMRKALESLGCVIYKTYRIYEKPL
jgi:GNAT superfamily N-acetyltransferase